MLRKKIQLSLSVDLVSSIDEFAKFNGVSRSSAISLLCSRALALKIFHVPSLNGKILDIDIDLLSHDK